MEKVTREQLVNAMNFATDALKSANKVCDNITDLIDEKLTNCKGKLINEGALEGFTFKDHDVTISIFGSFIQLSFVNEDLLKSLKKSDLKCIDNEDEDIADFNYTMQIIKNYRDGNVSANCLFATVSPFTIAEKLVRKLNIRLEKPDDVYDFYEGFELDSLELAPKSEIK